MAIPDEELASALRMLLRMDAGFYVGFAGTLEIGQLENLNYWVEAKDHTGRVLWYKDDIPLEEAIGHFLRIRRELGVGYDIESDLIRQERSGEREYPGDEAGAAPGPVGM